MKRIMVVTISAAMCASAGWPAGKDAAIIRDAGALWGRDGARVTIEGKVAREIWQHMVAAPKGYSYDAYFDMGTSQIVIYSKTPVRCDGTVRATGTVVKIEGSSKNPYRKEACTEYHVAIDSWECLK